MTMKTRQSKSSGDSKSGVKREFYSSTGQCQEMRKTSNKQPNLTSRAMRKRPTTNKSKSQQKEINYKDQSRN